MNIERLALSLTRLISQMDQQGFPTFQPKQVASQDETYHKFRIRYVSFFTSLNFSDRKTLTYLGHYHHFLGLYDSFEDGSQPNITAISNIFERIQKLRTDHAQLSQIVGSHAKVTSQKPIVFLEFPYNAGNVTASNFNTDISDVLSFVDRSSKALDTTAKDLFIESVENPDISIAVSVDWKFLLAVALIWNQISQHLRKSTKKKSAISTLEDFGLSEETKEKIELETQSNANTEYDEIIEKFKQSAGDSLSKEWKSEFVGLAKKLKQFRGRGFKLGIDADPTEIVIGSNTQELSDNITELLEYQRNTDSEVITSKGGIIESKPKIE